MRPRAIFLLILASLLWGSGWIFTPLLAQAAAPYASSALLLGVAALALAPFAVLGRPAIPASTTLLLSLTMFAVPAVLLTAAGQHGASGWAPLLYATMPLLLGLAQGQRSATTVVAIGAVLVLLNGTVPFAPSRLPWALLEFAAVGCQAGSLVAIAQYARGQALRSVLGSLAVQCAMAATMLVVCSFAMEPAPRLAPAGQWTTLSAAAVPVLGLGATALPYGVLYRLLAGGELQPRQIAVTQWWQTLIMVVESGVFAHVRPPLALVLAAAVLVMCSLAELRPESLWEAALTLRDTGPPK